MDKEIKKRIADISSGTVPEGYKKTPIGILPNDWQVARISDLAEKLTETAGKNKYETVSISAGIGFVNQAEKFGKELSGKQYEKYIVLHKGDFSYNKGNSNQYPQGCIYRLNDRETAAVPNVFESFRIVKGCPEYYEQLFISGFLNHQLYRLINHGVRDDGLLNLTGMDFYSCMLPVPPLREQEKIAEILTAYDTVIGQYHQNAQQYRDLKKVCMGKLLPRDGGLMPEVRFFGFTEPWKLRKLGEITLKIGSGKTPSGGRSTYSNSGIQLIRSQNVSDGDIDLSDVVYIDQITDDSMGSSRVFSNDVLLNITGASIGRSAVYEGSSHANVNQHVCIIRPKDNYLSHFLQLNLASEFGQRQIGYNQAGSGREGLNFQQVGNMQFGFPPIEEQAQIAMFFNSLDKLITLHQREVDEWRNNKSAMMQLLLNGLVRSIPGVSI